VRLNGWMRAVGAAQHRLSASCTGGANEFQPAAEL